MGGALYADPITVAEALDGARFPLRLTRFLSTRGDSQPGDDYRCFSHGRMGPWPGHDDGRHGPRDRGPFCSRVALEFLGGGG